MAACLIAVCSITPSRGIQGTKTYTSPNLGYTVRYPGNWHPEILSDVFYIENFPSAKAVKAVRLPSGGAGIKILLASQIMHDPAKMPATLEEFVRLDTSRDRIDARDSFELADESHRVPVLEVVTKCCAVAPYEESVAWYFLLSGRMFVASVTYWEGEPRSYTFRKVLKEIVLTLKVL